MYGEPKQRQAPNICAMRVPITSAVWGELTPVYGELQWCKSPSKGLETVIVYELTLVEPCTEERQRPHHMSNLRKYLCHMSLSLTKKHTVNVDILCVYICIHF